MADHDIRMIRGDTLDLVVGLSNDWREADTQTLSDYEGRLVFREEQNDLLPELMVITAVPEAATEAANAVSHLLDLSMTPAQTASLPLFPLVYFCEVRTTDGLFVRRLFSGNVIMED